MTDTAARTVAPRKKKSAARVFRERLPGMIMSAPALILFVLMFIIPMILAFILSLTDWNGYSLRFNFIQFENYLTAFSNPRTLAAASFTVVVAVSGTILCNLGGLILAALLVRPGRANAVLRTVFFYPFIISALIIGFLWSALLAPTGAINGFLVQVGLPTLPFLTDVNFARISVILTVVWASFGFNMILYIAGMKSVPTEYYEAATVDGASQWKQFWHITIPLIATVLTVNVVLTLSGLLKVYDLVLALTDGGPAGSTQTVVYQILKDSFAQSRLGFGAAQAVILLIVTAIIGIGVTLARRSSEKKATDA